MTLSVDDFTAFHVAVHGQDKRPFDWQIRLLRQIIAKRAWPRVLNLPTGSGKTTCIDIALFALALDAQEATNRWCPRRIAMIVDRRIVVDQAAERGRKLLHALVDEKACPVVRTVASLLRSLSKESADPIGVFTLRGGIPKDDGWARTPDQPLILASTVDQLGSRLLIQGYGVSKCMRSVHAGLLGNDLLLLLDEVHLSQPFADTLNSLDDLRRRFTRNSPVTPRFHHAFLSATPGAASEEPFRLSADAIDPGSTLGLRLHTPKPTRLVDVADRLALEKECVDQACALLERHDVVAVVVNRVASASVIARQLEETVGDHAEIVLLTGRMRPLDRDDALRALRARVMSGRDRSCVEKKLILVGTQCIEAGADFDFDALVTEAASLDALRQRFGRVDRLGLYRKAEGVIAFDKSVKEDPIYGTATSETVKWLKTKLLKRKKEIDFGVLALPLPADEELRKLAARKEHAPVMLPAYLDLWMQTAPEPMVVPDVSLWLHGPRSGPADVQVIWRADLEEDDLDEALNVAKDGAAHGWPTSIVATVRPSSLEAVPLPFAAACRWLRGEGIGEIADVEGLGDDPGSRAGRPVLRWNGEDSQVIPADKLRPGDTIVVPATRGGIRNRCFEPSSTATVADLAERAALCGRGQPVLRLHPKVLEQLELSLPVDDSEETHRALEFLSKQTAPSWRRVWLGSLGRSSRSILVDADRPWTVLQGKRLGPEVLRNLMQVDDTIENGIELTSDDDDSFHAGRSVPLGEHSTNVERLAREYAAEAGLTDHLVEDIALAGWLHDIGKADRRFQVLLRGGSEIDLFKDETPWAKSGMPPGAKAAHRLAQERSKYPKGARHEVQSVSMLEAHLDALKTKPHDIDLVLHLIASHHGHCRPFAPVVIDADPIKVALSNHKSQVFGVFDFKPTSSKHEFHRLNSPLADRFWRLVEKYGWQELCWLEAILRLADHRASEMEQSTRSVP